MTCVRAVPSDLHVEDGLAITRSPSTTRPSAARTSTSRRAELRGRGRRVRGIAPRRLARLQVRARDPAFTSPTAYRALRSRRAPHIWSRRRCRTTCTERSRRCSRSTCSIRVIGRWSGCVRRQERPLSARDDRRSFRAGRTPVKILFDREEVFLTNHGRHPTKTSMTIGATADGSDGARPQGAHRRRGVGVVRVVTPTTTACCAWARTGFPASGTRQAVYTNKPPRARCAGTGP